MKPARGPQTEFFWQLLSWNLRACASGMATSNPCNPGIWGLGTYGDNQQFWNRGYWQLGLGTLGLRYLGRQPAILELRLMETGFRHLGA